MSVSVLNYVRINVSNGFEQCLRDVSPHAERTQPGFGSRAYPSMSVFRAPRPGVALVFPPASLSRTPSGSSLLLRPCG